MEEKEDGTGEGREEGEERQIVWEEDEDEEDLGFSSGDDAEDEDGRQIEWVNEEEEEDDQLESVFAEDEKSRWGPRLVRAVFRTVKSLRRIGSSWWLQLWVSSGLRDRRRRSSLWSGVRVAKRKVTQWLSEWEGRTRQGKARQGQGSHEQRRSCGWDVCHALKESVE
jgi:hypothetical protein